MRLVDRVDPTGFSGSVSGDRSERLVQSANPETETPSRRLVADPDTDLIQRQLSGEFARAPNVEVVIPSRIKVRSSQQSAALPAHE